MVDCSSKRLECQFCQIVVYEPTSDDDAISDHINTSPDWFVNLTGGCLSRYLTISANGFLTIFYPNLQCLISDENSIRYF